MSSGASSAAGFRVASGRSRGQNDSRAAPVVYRKNPMDYEPGKMCNCNPRRKAPRWISWSVLNSGRRYYACVDAMNDRGCGYVEWHDATLPKFFSDLLGDLRDEVWRLRALENGARSAEEGTRDERVVFLETELRMRNVEIASLKGKFQAFVFAAALFVLGVGAGKYLSVYL